MELLSCLQTDRLHENYSPNKNFLTVIDEYIKFLMVTVICFDVALVFQYYFGSTYNIGQEEII